MRVITAANWSKGFEVVTDRKGESGPKNTVAVGFQQPSSEISPETSLVGRGRAFQGLLVC